MYSIINPDAGSVNVCSIDGYGTMNRLSVARYLKLSVLSAGNYRFEVVPTVRARFSHAVMSVLKKGRTIVNYEVSDRGDTLGFDNQLDAGIYVLAVSEKANVDPNQGTGGKTCFDVTVTSL